MSNPSKKRVGEKPKSDRVDLAVDIAETIVEEAGGLGLARRLVKRVKKHLLKDSLARISELTLMNEQLIDANTKLALALTKALQKLEEKRDS